MGASILPVTIHNNKIMFLFGKERDIDENPGWSDFGGGTDAKETFIQTAIREGSEEMTGFLGSSSDVKSLLTKYGTYNIDYKNDGYSTYRCHIFPMAYDEKLPFYYNNNQQFLQKKLDSKIIRDTKIFEKTQLKWFTFKEMEHNIKDFRSFYQNIVTLILGNRKSIDTFLKKAFKKTISRHNKTRTRHNKTRTRHNKTSKN
jgi:hypothetical protein